MAQLSPAILIALQRSAGNAAVNRLLQRRLAHAAPLPCPKEGGAGTTQPRPVVQRLIGAEMLMAQLGDRPHADRLFGLKEMSTHYKPIIESLNAYHAFVSANKVEKEDSRADVTFKVNGAQRALALLDAVSAAVAGYTKADEKKRRIDQLAGEVQQERALIQQIAASNFPGANPTWALAIAFTRSGMTPDAGPNVKVGDFTDQRLAGEANKDKFKQLGSGQINTVYTGTYARTGGAANATSEAVLKEDVPVVTEGGADVDRELGIPAHNPKFAARNVAIYRLSRLLELDVIPETEFALQGTQLSTAMAKVKGDTAVKNTEVQVTDQQVIRDLEEKWERYSKLSQKDLPARGDPTRAVIQTAKDKMNELNLKYLRQDKKFYHRNKLIENGFDFNDPNLRKSLMNLQLVDAVAASGDRHLGNYMRVKNAEGAVTGVQGFDNDSAFGDRIRDPNALRDAASTHSHNVGLPNVVDRQVAMRILAKKAALPAQIQAELQGLLSPTEIQATIERVRALIQHLEVISYEETAGRANPIGKFVNDWQHMTEQTLAMLNDPKKSYVGRDKATTERLRAEGLNVRDLTTQGRLIRGK